MRNRGSGTQRLPHMRVLLRHVYSQLDELLERGSRTGAAGQRHGRGHACEPPVAVRAGRAQDRGAGAHWYEREDASVLPRSIACKAAFSNAMTLDIAMGGSTNTVLHLLAVAQEAGVDFTMQDIDSLSRRVPCLCKVSPSSHYHVEDVNRAGGVLGIMGELDRAGLLDTSVMRWTASLLPKRLALGRHDERRHAAELYSARPPDRPQLGACSQLKLYEVMDNDREKGCIRNAAHCYSQEGGLAVLYGNIAEQGCIVKTAGVDPSILHSPARPRSSSPRRMRARPSLAARCGGDVVFILYEGPKGGPGMQEMLYPTSYLKSKHLGKLCALVTDGRFSGGTAGLSIGHVSPEAAGGGAIALVATAISSTSTSRCAASACKSARQNCRAAAAKRRRAATRHGSRRAANARCRRRCAPMPP